MACDRALEWISRALDGDLSETEQRQLEAHLETCPDCRALQAQLIELHTALDGLGESQAPEGFAGRVMWAIQAEEAGGRPSARRRPVWRRWGTLAACAAVCVGLWGAGMVYGQSPASQAQPSVQSVGIAPAQAGSQDEGPQTRGLPGGQSIQPFTADPTQPVAILTVEVLPEGAQALLGEDAKWTPLPEGGTQCLVSGAVFTRLVELAGEAGALTGDGWTEDSLCALVVLS